MGLIGGDENTAHVLVIPLPLQGHMIPILGIAKQLARKGIPITVVSFEDEISRLKSTGSSSELQSLGFQLIGLDNPGIEKTGYAVVLTDALREAFKPLIEKWVQDKRSGGAGPTCILSDMFLPWTQDIADTLQIPRYMFSQSGVIIVKNMQSFPDLFEHGVVHSGTDGKLVKFDGSVDIPGIFPLRYHELPDSLLHWPAEYFLLRSKALWRARGILANSFYELEEQMIEKCSIPNAFGSEHTKAPKIYPLAPLFSTSVIVPEIAITHGLEDAAEKSLVWLGSQPSCSVLYVAFGTLAHLSSEHINELALGLEDSNQRFLWVLPPSKVSSEEEAPSITNVLPPGFQARVGDRGCIVTGWVPQLQILAHSSTAAFLTHSGWNSCLESIIMGVPMISWPQQAEQHLNCRYLTDIMKISIQLQTGAENILDRKEVVRTVRLLMEESEGKEIRGRVEDLQRKGAAAVAEGGSQSKFFQEFVDDIYLTAKTGDT